MNKSFLLIPALIASAQAVTIDFESLPISPGGGIAFPNNYEEDGFKLSIPTVPPTFAQFVAFGEGWQSNRGSSDGTTTAAAYRNGSAPSFQVVSANGAAFTLNSIDFAELLNVGDFAFANSSKIITVTGVKESSTLTTTLTLDQLSDGAGGLADFQTFNFSAEWTELLNVTFVGSITTQDAYMQFDNIVLNEVVASVPDGGATAALLGLGFAGIAYARRKVRA